MPKMKTKKSAAKRFKTTASGRVRRSKAKGQHIMTNKTRKQKRRLRHNDMVHDSMEKRIKRLLPYG
jgi:large subunit ribosomal protein L35